MSASPQSKPEGDFDALETFSLAERRTVESPMPEGFVPDSVRRNLDAIVQDEILPEMDRSLRKMGAGDSGQNVRSELAALRAWVESSIQAIEASVGLRPPIPKPDPDADVAIKGQRPSSPTIDEREEAAGLENTMEGRGEPPPTMDEREEAAGLENTMEGRGEPPPTMDEREEAAGLENTTSGRSESDKDEEDETKKRETSSDSMPVAHDVRGKVHIPGVAEFEIWTEIDNAPNGWTKLSLKGTVSNLTLQSYEFVNEFTTGSLSDMTEFSGDDQTSFTMPLAEKIANQGNSWMPCTQGGVYILPTFCVNGKGAIFPLKVS